MLHSVLQSGFYLFRNDLDRVHVSCLYLVNANIHNKNLKMSPFHLLFKKDIDNINVSVEHHSKHLFIWLFVYFEKEKSIINYKSTFSWSHHHRKICKLMK